MSAPGIGEALPQVDQAGCVYLDYNATTPVWPEVAAAAEPFLRSYFGNPSSAHAFGRPCKAALEAARQQVADLVGASVDEIHFTASGTESDNWAIWGTVADARARRPQGPPPHVVTSAIEHPAILECLQALGKQGLLSWTAVPVDAQGRVDAAAVAAAVGPATALVTLMHSNNEVGTLQPVAAAARAARAAAARAGGALLRVHTDAAQSAGKVALDVGALGVDLMTLVGHKFGAPKGIAALYIKRGTDIGRLLCGGGQEFGRRAGTENVCLAVALGAAAAIARRELPEAAAHMAATRGRLLHLLRVGLPGATLRVHGADDPAGRLPNTLSVGIAGVSASALLGELSDRLAASAGAACHSGVGGAAVSPVLRAMGVAEEYALGTLRLSTGRHTTQRDVDGAARLILAYAAAHGVPVCSLGAE